MTTNEKIYEVVVGGCLHKWKRFVTNADSFDLYNSYDYKCEKCGMARRPIGWKSPDYITPDGIALIKAWLVKEGKWKDFIWYLYHQYHNSKAKTLRIIEFLMFMFDIATDPAAFCKYFIKFCGSEGLIEKEICNVCNGSGQDVMSICQVCKGTGYRHNKEL